MLQVIIDISEQTAGQTLTLLGPRCHIFQAVQFVCSPAGNLQLKRRNYYIHLIGALRRNQENFTYTIAARAMVRGKKV